MLTVLWLVGNYPNVFDYDSYLADWKFAKLTPNWETWNVMSLFEATLKPYAELTDAMSMEKSVGICKLYPLLLKVQTKSERSVDNDELTVEQVANSLDIRRKIWEYMDCR